MDHNEDEIIGGEYGKPDRGICPKCGEWGCEEHAGSYSDLNENPMAGLSEPLQEKLKDIFDKIDVAAVLITERTAEEIKKALEDGKDIVINTGEDDKFIKVELTEAEKKELREHIAKMEGEEAAEENEDWELPVPTSRSGSNGPQKKKVGVTLSGGTMLYADSGIDNDVPGEPASEDWLEKIGDEMVNSMESGMPRSLEIFRPKANGERAIPIRNKALEIVPRLRRQLQLAMEAEARVSRQRQQKSGLVDRGQVARLVAAGKDDIFAKKADRKTIKTAITIILDDSSSMRQTPGRGTLVTYGGVSATGDPLLFSKNGTAGVLAYALGEVCNSLGIQFEVLSYQGGAYFSYNHYAMVYKSFNDPWVSVRDRIGNYRCDAGTDIPHDAAAYGARRLLARPEDRRMMFFLTDANECNSGIEEMGKFADELKRKANIIMIGVSILTDKLPKFMGDKAISVMRLEELTDAVFAKMLKIINAK